MARERFLLSGRRVVVTRAEHQATGLVELLRSEGAEVAHLPLLQVLPPADAHAVERAASELERDRYDWIAFTSANAVEAFLAVAKGKVPASVEIAVVGSATAAALRTHGLEPRLEARKREAEGLAEAMASRIVAGTRVLLPQAADARPALAAGLRAVGAEVTTVVAYDKRLPPGAVARAETLFGGRPLGWVTFTSPRIARHFAELFGSRWPERRTELDAASIGRVTTAELRNLGVERIAEAETPEDAALVRAIVDAGT